MVEELGVGRRVRPWGTPDRRLVDFDHLVEDLDAFDRVMVARLRPVPVQLVRQRLVDDLVHERRLAGA